MLTPEHLPKKKAGEKADKKISELPIMKSGYGIVYRTVMDDPELTSEAKAIYAYFASYANHKSNIAYPSHATIHKELRIGDKRFYDHFDRLCGAGYISAEKHTQKTKFAKSTYRMMPIMPEKAEMGYGMIPRTVMRDSSISINAKALYAYLIAHAGVNQQFEFNCDRIKKRLGMGREALLKAKKELESHRLIDVIKMRSDNGKFVGRLYALVDDPEHYQPQSENRRAEEPRAEEPRTEEPRAEEPRTEEPRTEGRETNISTVNSIQTNNTYIQHYPSINIETDGEMDTTEIEDFVIDSILSKEGIDDDILVDDKFRVITARLLSSWYEKSYRKAWGQGELAGVGHKTYGLYVDALADLLDPAIEKRTICKTCVSHWRLIETINRRIIINGMDFYLPFEAAVDDFVQAVTTKDIKSKFSYMQSCIWQALLKGDIDDEAPAAC